MSYIVNPETGRRVLADGKIGQQILKQYGGGCNEKDTGFCELNMIDKTQPKINKNGQYGCHYKTVLGNTNSNTYIRDTGNKENNKYCECYSNKCKGVDSTKTPYTNVEKLPATLSQKKKQERQERPVKPKISEQYERQDKPKKEVIQSPKKQEKALRKRQERQQEDKERHARHQKDNDHLKQLEQQRRERALQS